MNYEYRPKCYDKYNSTLYSIIYIHRRQVALSPPCRSGDVHWLENFNNPSDDRPEKYACPNECVTDATRTRGDTLNFPVPPCPPTPFPSVQYSCLLIGRTRFELCRACADRFKKAEDIARVYLSRVHLPTYTLENIRDYRTISYHRDTFC